MTHLKDKSTLSLQAAHHLIVNSIFAPSVHCSYYSCVQYILYILSSNYNKTELEIYDDFQNWAKTSGKASGGGGYHNFLRNSIYREFYKIDKTYASTFNTMMGNMHGLRVKADYKNCSIISEQATEVQESAKAVLSLLKKNFKQKQP